jgi:hypothetical protein
VKPDVNNGGSTALGRALARRERHRGRPFFLRALTVAALLVLVAAAVEVWLRFGFLPPLSCLQ